MEVILKDYRLHKIEKFRFVNRLRAVMVTECGSASYAKNVRKFPGSYRGRYPKRWRVFQDAFNVL